MVYITIDGRISVSGLKSDEGDLIRTGTLWLVDGTRLILPVDHNIPAYSITSSLHENAVTGDLISYNVTIDCTNNVDPGAVLNVTIPIPSGFILEGWNSDQGDYDSVTETWTPVMDNQTCSINLILSCEVVGVQSQTITLNNTGDELVSSCEILAADSDGDIYYTEFTITDTDTLANLQDGEVYTLLLYGYVNDSTLAEIYDGVYNNRVVVDNSETYIGERVTTEGVYEKLSVVFTYDDSDSIVITLYGQYQSVSTTCDDRWAGIGLYQGYQTEYNEPVNLLTKPEALLDDTNSTDITLPSKGNSADYIYNITVPSFTDARDFFSGAELTINSFGDSNSGIEITLESSNGSISNPKSSYIARTGKVTFGDMMDLWGLSSNDIEGKTLNIRIRFTNTSLTEQTLSYNNITLTLYYIRDETGSSPGFTAKGIHSMNYQLFVQEVEIPEGPDRDIGTVNFPLSDGETIVNYSLKSKELKVKFVVWGNTLDDAKRKLRNINKWLTNERNNLSIPEPYTLIFDFEDDMSYNVILGEPIDTDISYTAIECEATFTVESGVALTTTQKTTGPVGSNDGIIKVKPVITLLADGSASITLTDSVSSQELGINTTIPDGTILLIDCEERTVTDSEGNDYTEHVDIESIWFHITNQYNLLCNGGVVQSVAFYEGY